MMDAKGRLTSYSSRRAKELAFQVTCILKTTTEDYYRLRLWGNWEMEMSNSTLFN